MQSGAACGLAYSTEYSILEKMRLIIKGGLYSRVAFIALAATERNAK